MMSVTPVTMRLGHCCSALLMPPHKISTAWKPSTFAQSSPPRPPPAHHPESQNKRRFQTMFMVLHKVRDVIQTILAPFGSHNCPSLAKRLYRREGWPIRRRKYSNLYMYNTIVRLWILDTGSPLLYLYNTFLPHMCDKILCQMTVFIYIFDAFHIKISEQLIFHFYVF